MSWEKSYHLPTSFNTDGNWLAHPLLVLLVVNSSALTSSMNSGTRDTDYSEKLKSALPGYFKKPHTFSIQGELSQAIPVTFIETCISSYTTSNLDFLYFFIYPHSKNAQNCTLNTIASSLRITVHMKKRESFSNFI